MPRRGSLLVERRQQGAIVGKLALRVQHLDQRAFAALAALLGEVDVALVVVDQRLRGGDARIDRRDRDHLGHDLTGDREMCRFGLAQLGLGIGGGLLALAALAAEQVEIERGDPADRIEMEFGVGAGEAVGGEIDLLLLEPRIGVELGQARALDRGELLARLHERRVAGGERVIAGERAVDQIVDHRRSERRPPAQLAIAARDHPVGLFARGDIGACGRRGGTLEIGADGAAAEQGEGGQSRDARGQGLHSEWIWTAATPGRGLRTIARSRIDAVLRIERIQKASI